MKIPSLESARVLVGRRSVACALPTALFLFLFSSFGVAQTEGDPPASEAPPAAEDGTASDDADESVPAEAPAEDGPAADDDSANKSPAIDAGEDADSAEDDLTDDAGEDADSTDADSTEDLTDDGDPAADENANANSGDPASDGAAAAAEGESPPEASAAEESDSTSSTTELTEEIHVTDEVGSEPDDPTPGQAKPLPLALELLPPLSYPNQPKPGIPGGSLALMINRLQWPYMPKYGEDEPDLRVGFSGFSWVDSNLRSLTAGSENEADQTEYRMQGRLKLRVNPVYNLDNDWFLQSSLEFVANVDQTRTTNYVDVDEAWVRVGKWKLFDIQVGRMQGFEVYHFGMGLDLNTFERQGAVSVSNAPAQPYGLTDLWDRGISNGAVAVHWYLPEWLRLEFMTRFGRSGQGTDIGIRPVGVIDLGWMKFKAGYERRLSASLFEGNDGRTEMQGLSSALQFVVDPWIEFGGGIGHRVVDSFEQDGAVIAAGSNTTVTAGGFVNVRPYFEDWLVGLGYHHTEQHNFNFDSFGEPENSTHDQMYGAVQYMLWDRLYIKYVLGYARGHIENRNDTDRDDTGFVNEALSHRLRLMMLF